ncbi:SRPBCC domain-containing protein [Pedobacter yulinensis]|uniref:SRPBCC domain-containing protein n=1 Tax=Pedobacter yulinensis TaxID=2126353 RepID=A0A2T3HPF5_9SPHI|nr:SRPBCC domain-containing protein [Pedobacter yulinensis]PST84335.1 SRPBCC domain-containing protein [Pedobacter yulinensis]
MNTVVVEEFFNASVAVVWKALTEKAELEKWYFNLSDFRAEPGFEFSFEGRGHSGDRLVHICRITEVTPRQRLEYSWQYTHLPGFSLVTFELFEEGGGARLRVTHTGLDSFPQNRPDFTADSFTGGWTEILTAWLAGYLRSMNK